MLPVVNGSLGSGKNGCSWGGCAFSEASISSIQSEFGGGTVGLGALGVLPHLQMGLPPLIGKLTSSCLRVGTVPVGVTTVCGSEGSTAASGVAGTSGVGGVSTDRVAVERVLALRSFGVGSGSASSVEGEFVSSLSVVTTSISLAA